MSVMFRLNEIFLINFVFFFLSLNQNDFEFLKMFKTNGKKLSFRFIVFLFTYNFLQSKLVILITNSILFKQKKIPFYKKPFFKKNMRHPFQTYILEIQHRRFVKRFFILYYTIYFWTQYILKSFSPQLSENIFNPKRTLIPTIYWYEILIHI